MTKEFLEYEGTESLTKLKIKHLTLGGMEVYNKHDLLNKPFTVNELRIKCVENKDLCIDLWKVSFFNEFPGIDKIQFVPFCMGVQAYLGEFSRLLSDSEI